MKDHQQLQTPQREISSRRSKYDSASSKPSADKLAKKSLKSAFDSIATGDPILKSTGDFSAASSEVADANQEQDSSEMTSESVEIFSEICNSNHKKQASVELISAAASEASATSDLTSCEQAASVADRMRIIAGDQGQFSRSAGADLGSLEADLIAYHLKRAGLQVLISKDVDEVVKKVLDALINVVLKEVYAVPDGEKENGCVESVVSARVCVVSFCFLMWIVVVMATVVISGAGDRRTFEMPPT